MMFAIVAWSKSFYFSLRKNVFPQCWFLIYISHICCYTQLECIFIRKISHLKKTLKFAGKNSACKSSCKNLHASFLHKFFVEIHHIARYLRMCKCCNASGLYCRCHANRQKLASSSLCLGLPPYTILSLY